MDIGYKGDEIFLLSIEEYEYYEDKIPHENCWWWLRFSGYNQHFAAAVDIDGSVRYRGHNVHRDDGAVRPTLKYSNLEFQIIKFSVRKDRFLFHEFLFKIIDEENKIAIAEVPIAFDKFDEKSNDYETSGIRRKLLKWFETGTWNYAGKSLKIK